MIETNQFLERYRTLSRDMQNGLQVLQKQTEAMKKTHNSPELEKLVVGLNEVSEYWQDFVGWVLISTLDNAEDTRKNCAPGRIDLQSKITRAKHKRRRDLENSGIKVDGRNVSSATVETFIPYFEQLLDLVLSNGIKYSPKGGEIEVTAGLGRGSCRLTFSSMGPLVEKHEKTLLGTKGFRSDAARRLPLSGDGFGLFNVLRIAELIGASVAFRPDARTAMHIGGIPYACFEVDVILPMTVN